MVPAVALPVSKHWLDLAGLRVQFVTGGPPCPSPSAAAGEREGARRERSPHYRPHLLLIWARSLVITNPAEHEQGQGVQPASSGHAAQHGSDLGTR